MNSYDECRVGLDVRRPVHEHADIVGVRANVGGDLLELTGGGRDEPYEGSGDTECREREEAHFGCSTSDEERATRRQQSS